MSSSTPLPHCRVLLRSKDGVEVFSVPSERDQESSITTATTRNFLFKGPTTSQALLPDGSAVLVQRPDQGIFKLDLTANTTAETTTTPFFQQSTSRVQIMDVSPQGTFLLTWERAQEGETPNLKVWRISDGALVIGFRQKSLSRDSWPYLQWTNDEKLAFLHCTNEVRVYPGSFPQAQETRFLEKMRIPGITSMSVPSQAPGTAGRILFTAFIPKDKNKPSRAALFEYPSSQPSHPTTGYPALLSKSLFQAEEMTVHWSPKGDAALIALQSTVDTSGQSYYGSTSLYLMSPQVDDTVAVPLPQEGPVLDVAWMPNPDKPPTFTVIAGRMPAMASLHNGTDGKATFLFGNRHQNTVQWAPHGRFLFLAGFGNLAGDMTFWDKNKEKQIPPAYPVTAACTVGYGWSPDSRLICVSTTSPRMNVDNGCHLYRYNGDKVSRTPWDNQNYLPDRLLQACFLPALADVVYPDRPQSPSLKDLGKGPDAASATTAASTAGAAAPKPAGRYIPPSARNRAGGGVGGGTSLAERMRAEREGTMKGAQRVVDKKTPVKVVGVTGQVVVGMAPPPTEQGKSKSAQRREKQKQKKQEEEARKKLEEKLAADQKAAAAATESMDPEKRARKLKKILKQIDDLKQKDPETLNDDQKKKIASEAELLEELQKLGI
ncbi:translation initiation factor eIF2A [Nitzschia inconspicua]|uniref:Translation initiation factor eIF2A n=1 Tax=Nitzschia inconspicua TaxID=303405 RepID=A0A9K3LBB0_9STRA|nr:translation initiation factor eIF2A [Nitzschia inconspicua]